MSDVALGSNQMSLTFRVRTSAGTGTCFLYGTEQGFCFLSAGHVFRGVTTDERIFFEHSSGWVEFIVSEINHHPDAHDVVVFTTDMKVGGTSNFDNEFRVFPGQPLKFLGFPHGMQNNYPGQNGFVTPLVRSANFSGVSAINTKEIQILDGFNNPGYSGGPVFCCGEDGEPKLFGVISGFRYEVESLGKLYKKAEDGEIVEVKNHFVKQNSGIIYAVGIRVIRELLSKVKVFQPKPDN